MPDNVNRQRDGAVAAGEDGAPVRMGRSGRRADYRPEGHERKTGFMATAKRTFKEFSEDQMTDWAAALTYYGVLSLFPMLIALTSIIGLVGVSATSLTNIISDIGPASAAETFKGPIQNVTQSKGTAGIAFVVGLLLALNAASGYVGAYMRASNIAFETPEGRGFFKLKPLQILVTLVMVILLAVIAAMLVLSGPIVDAVAKEIGIGSAGVTVWNIAKWPVLAGLFILMLMVLFYAAPNVKQRGFKFVWPGALVGLVVWIIASALFSFYVANFGSYNKTYGALAGVIVFLLWVWLTNVSLLLGTQLNSERERSAEIDEGVEGAEKEIQADARDEPKTQTTT